MYLMNIKKIRWCGLIKIIISILLVSAFLHTGKMAEMEEVQVLPEDHTYVTVDSVAVAIDMPQEPPIETVEVPEPVVAPPEPNPWWTEEEYDLLCRVVMAEGGSDSIVDEVQQGIAAVVINRMNYPGFADTIHDVIYSPGQYSCAPYLHTITPTERVRENTLIALKGDSGYPEDVVWQAGFPQAAWNTSVKIYKVFDTKPNKTYFCHYGE